jgi:hypothetical protein
VTALKALRVHKVLKVFRDYKVLALKALQGLKALRVHKVLKVFRDYKV